jgi:hypothetical protein
VNDALAGGAGRGAPRDAQAKAEHLVGLSGDRTRYKRSPPEGGHYRGGRCESYGLPVSGSFGTTGFASKASRLGTTSITPYMRT